VLVNRVGDEMAITGEKTPPRLRVCAAVNTAEQPFAATRRRRVSLLLRKRDSTARGWWRHRQSCILMLADMMAAAYEEQSSDRVAASEVLEACEFGR
jgi:hypothetical protein